MEKGIQLSVKVNGVLLNIYEPDRVNSLDAIDLLDDMVKKVKQTFKDYQSEYGEIKEIDPLKQEKPTTAPTNAEKPQFCSICGKQKIWVKWKGKDFKGNDVEGFWGCPDKCKK